MDAPALQSGAAMSINTGLLVICAAVFTLVAGSLYVVSRALDTEGDIVRAEARRYSSYKLADELRQSSDDLTRMAQLYVVTGDARWTTGTCTGTSRWRGASCAVGWAGTR
jgi:hypothetical protein